MTITDARKASFDFSDNYYESGLQFAVAADSKITDLEGLRGKKIAVKTGTAGADLANKLKDDYKFTVMTFKDSANMYEDVLTGNSDATIEDAPVIAYAIKNGNRNTCSPSTASTPNWRAKPTPCILPCCV